MLGDDNAVYLYPSARSIEWTHLERGASGGKLYMTSKVRFTGNKRIGWWNMGLFVNVRLYGGRGLRRAWYIEFFFLDKWGCSLRCSLIFHPQECIVSLEGRLWGLDGERGEGFGEGNLSGGVTSLIIMHKVKVWVPNWETHLFNRPGRSSHLCKGGATGLLQIINVRTFCSRRRSA